LTGKNTSAETQADNKARVTPQKSLQVSFLMIGLKCISCDDFFFDI
jgi:hypothetical protein